MKKFKKFSAVLLAILLCLSIMAIPVCAAPLTQDGLEVTLSTDKAEYQRGEKITAFCKKHQ